MPIRLCGAALLSIIVVFASAPQPAQACIYHGTPGAGGAAHPHAAYVALATQQAMQEGTLTRLSALPPALGAMRVNRWLRDLARTLHASAKKSGTASSANFAMLVADAGLWSRYQVDRENDRVDIHVAGPADERVVLITSEAVLSALTSGHIGAAQAIQRGLIAVVGDDADALQVTASLTAAL